MSFIHKIFGGGVQQPQAQQVQQQVPSNNPMNNPAPAAPLQTQNTAPNGVIPADGQAAANQENKSPLDQFNNLWEATPTDPATQNQNVEMTTEDFMKAAEKVDFTRVISQDTLGKINAGGQEGTQAFLDAMNKMQQVAFGQSLAASNKLMAQKVAEAEKKFSSQVPTLLRKQNVNEQLLQKNPALAHPTVQPVIQAVQSQLAEKYPKASQTELALMAENLVSQMGEAFKPTPKPKTAEIPKEEDWSDLT